MPFFLLARPFEKLMPRVAMLNEYAACPPIVKVRFASNRLLRRPVPVRTLGNTLVVEVWQRQ